MTGPWREEGAQDKLPRQFLLPRAELGEGRIFRQVSFSNTLDKDLRGRSWVRTSKERKSVFTEQLLFARHWCFKSALLTKAHDNLENRHYAPHFAYGETKSLCP